MVYVDTPLALEDQDVSQPLIRNNFQQANTSFGTDHYAFNDLTANNGFHNQMTTPLIVGSAHPTTAAGILKMYAMQDSANIGLLNYSRGPSNSVPTPLTSLQSPAAPISLDSTATTNILDFTGLNMVIGEVYGFCTGANLGYCYATVFWSGATTTITLIDSISSKLTFQISGNILQLRNFSGITLSNNFWTLVFHRIQ